jgi:MFS superfamily sulfate permease-like transporter
VRQTLRKLAGVTGGLTLIAVGIPVFVMPIPLGLPLIALGLFLAASIAGVFSVFPAPIVGAMMLMIGIELTKFARHIRPGRDLVALAVTVAVSVLANMAWGFLAGMAAHRLVERAAGGKA